MKSTDIPNGCVMQGFKGKSNILIDIDERGKLSSEYREISITGWPTEMFKDGMLLSNLVVLIHSVKGEEGMLIRRLHACTLSMQDGDISIRELLRLKMFVGIIEKIWQDYMTEAIHALSVTSDDSSEKVEG